MTVIFLKLRSYLIPLAFFGIFTLLVCFRIIFSGETLFTGDNFDLLFPQKHFWVNEIIKGRIPLWNPYILSGTPYLADINLGTLAPSNLIYLIITPVERAASLLFTLELFVIGFFTYLVSRRYKVSQLGSVIAGLTFMCSGVILIYITNLAILNVIVFLPIIFYFLDKAFQEKSLGLVIFCGILFALQVISGHAQLTYYTGLLVTFLVLTKEKINLLTKIKILLTIFLVAFSASAIQILPFLEFAKYTSRVNQGYQWATVGSLGFMDLVKFIWPKFVWSFSGWIDFSSKVNLGYIGVIPFILFLIGLTAKERKWKILIIIALLSVVAALGKNTPFYRLLYLLLPGISALKVPSQTISIYSFVAALLAGKGFDLLKEKNFIFIESLHSVLGVFVGFFITLFLLSLFLIWKIPFLESIFSSFKLAVWFLNFLFLIQFVLLFLISLLLMKKRKYFLGSTIIFISLILDLFLSARTVLLTAPVTEISTNDGLSNLVISSDQRIYTIPLIQKPASKIFNPSVEKIFAREKSELLLPNQNIYRKIPALDGYASMSIASYLNEFTDSSKTVTGLGRLELSQIDFKDRGVSFILSQEEVPDFKNNNQFLLVQTKKPVVYKIINTKKRFYLEGDGEVKFISEDSRQLTLRAIAKQPTRLLLLDNFFPGWKASVNGLSTPIDRYEKIYRNIYIPAGSYLIQFLYLPATYSWGKLISLLSIVVWFLLFGFYRNKKIA